MGGGVSGLCGSEEEEACKPSICTEGISEGKNSMYPPHPIPPHRLLRRRLFFFFFFLGRGDAELLDQCLDLGKDGMLRGRCPGVTPAALGLPLPQPAP